MPNRLATSSSPYLRQHADNPIDWRPWGPEAFEQAKRLDRPVLLSVGYSSCHWCHVMAHESFEDGEVAAVLNAYFVSVKVDREERPDVDEAYMTAVQLASGRGGWPMTLFLTPDGKPFFAGTYFPKDDRGGSPGFLTILKGIAKGWAESRQEFVEAADGFAESLAETLARELPAVEAVGDPGRGTLEALAHEFDPRYGGFGGAPKFPPHTAIEFLLAVASHGSAAPGSLSGGSLSQEERDQALHLAESTLLAMAAGGIRDHVGGGFHRYSTDAAWGLPHFEKMLVDNALMLANYARAAQSADPETSKLFKRVADEIVEWLRREMRTEDGLWCSAMDADSEGEEGRFYVWTWQEVRQALDAEADGFLEAYGFAPNGNFLDEATGVRSGANIPMLDVDTVRDADFRGALAKLLAVRSRRAAPGLDDKALVGQNGLLIAGLALAGEVELAAATAARLLKFFGEDGSLPHQVVAGAAEGIGYLDDYAGLGFGLSALAEADPSGPWRDAAARIAGAMVERFRDDAKGGFFSTSPAHEKLFGRTKPTFDHPAPSGNALACRLLIRVGRREEAMEAIRALSGWLHRAPTATEALALALLESGGRLDASVEAWIEWTTPGTVGTVHIRIPPGAHLQSAEDGDPALVPTRLSAPGEELTVEYPTGEHGRYEGEVRIPFRLSEPVELSLSFQVCSETECQLPETRTFE